MKRFQSIIYALSIFSVILQLGKHFWPPYAFISGIRVDYLSPILYVSDIILLFLIVTYFLNRRNRQIFYAGIQKYHRTALIPLFILVVMFSTFSARISIEAWYGLGKLVEMALFSYITAQEIGKTRVMRMAVRSMLLGSSVVAILAYLQFFVQHSIGGALYYLGERSFSLSTGGIAKFDMFGTSVLRPYATFPHPNVLAYFLFVTITLSFFYFYYYASSQEKMIIFPIMLIDSVALLLSFSRVVITVFFIGIFILLWRQQRFSRWALFFTVGSLLLFVLGVELRFTNTALFARDILLRVQLLNIAASLVQHNFWFGVGLNNFLYYEAPLQKQFSPIYLQPVHNIFLLSFAEIGVVGFFCFIYFILHMLQQLIINIKTTITDVSRKYYQVIGYLFIATLVIGLFDHYLFTLQQGQILTAFVFGLVWSHKV